MIKRFQVFVSSTYQDLMEERAEVMQALLELDWMPAGMELFPAASQEQWEWIERVIRESDYYIVIAAGRYGTRSSLTNLSFTEMEYRFAVDSGVPAISFLHEDIGMLPNNKCDQEEESRLKLSEFRYLIEKRLCKYYTDPVDLGAKVSRSITQLIKHNPRPGWIPANSLDPSHSEEVLMLRKKIDELEAELSTISLRPPSGTEDLAQGEDKFGCSFAYEIREAKIGKSGRRYWVQGERKWEKFELSWDDLLRILAPLLITRPASGLIISRLNDFGALMLRRSLSEIEVEAVNDVRIVQSDLDNIKMQLRALGILEVISEQYHEKWQLTRFGDHYVTRLTARRRTKSRKSRRNKLDSNTSL